MSIPRRLVWFRSDLRLHDNETLTRAVGQGEYPVTFLFVYDAALEQATRQGFPRVSTFRKRYIAETVIALRESLAKLGGELVIAFGDPVEVVTDVCAQRQINEVYYSRLSTHDERRQEAALERQLSARGVGTFSFRTHSLLHPEDFSNDALLQPMGFSKLKKYAEDGWLVRSPLRAITHLGPAPSASDALHIKRWNPDSLLDQPVPKKGVALEGGEEAALGRVKHYIWTKDQLRMYKSTRNGLLNLDDSSKFSAPLALGAISPRLIYGEVRRYERERVANGSTLWFLYEMLWRDFFHFAAAWRGAALFTSEWTLKSAEKTPAQSDKSFRYWCEGRTQNQFIDAAMIELKSTGWMSNRMRQNAASYLIHHLGVDWRVGSSWFESHLVDYDPASNWGNWAYVAGAGERNQSHVFDVDQQAAHYDPSGAYVRYWLDGSNA